MAYVGSSFGRCAALEFIHIHSEPNSFYYDIGKNVIIESFALCYYYYKKPIKSFTHIRIINLRTGLISRLYSERKKLVEKLEKSEGKKEKKLYEDKKKGRKYEGKKEKRKEWQEAKEKKRRTL